MQFSIYLRYITFVAFTHIVLSFGKLLFSTIRFVQYRTNRASIIAKLIIVYSVIIIALNEKGLESSLVDSVEIHSVEWIRRIRRERKFSARDTVSPTLNEINASSAMWSV